MIRPMIRPETLRAPLWVGLFAVSLALAALSARLPSWALLPPAAVHLNFAGAVSAAMTWLVEQASFGLFTVKEATRAFAALVDLPYEAARMALVDGITEGRGRRAVTIIPPVSWIAVIGAVAALGAYARSLWLG
ncbi:MAG TPA: hypothetical protein VGA75_14265, partial [Paracoccaceae bacterium]